MGINTKKTKRNIRMNIKDKLFFRLTDVVLNKRGCSAAIIGLFCTSKRPFMYVLRREIEKLVLCASKAVRFGSSSIVFCGLRGNTSM
jgi:hypothetical protein